MVDTIFRLQKISDEMNISLNRIYKKVKNNSYLTEVKTSINLLVNNFVNLNDEIKFILTQYPENNLSESISELAKYFNDINCYYELQESNLIEDVLVKYLIPRFKKFYNDLDAYFLKIAGVKKAIVIGINEIVPKIEALVDLKKCRISALVSNNNEIKEEYINNIPVIKMSEISFINYDYVIVIDDSNCNIEGKKVLDFHDYIQCFYDFEVFRAYDTYIKQEKPIDGFITGMSCAAFGIDPSKLSYNVINVAVSSQDLFYDYEWAKMILNNEKIGSNVKFAIIGLIYFSFEYDLSKNHLKDRVFKYYPFFKDNRNHPLAQEFIIKYNKFEQAALEIFKDNYNDLIYDIYFKEESQKWWDDLQNQVIDEFRDEEVRKEEMLMVERHSNKDYPKTRDEYNTILREYLSLLKSKNIKPIIVVCPTSRDYYTNFSKALKEEYKNDINKIKDEFDVEIFDYFEDKTFSCENFYDLPHLNKNGARKFTKLLNDRLVNMKLDKIKLLR